MLQDSLVTQETVDQEDHLVNRDQMDHQDRTVSRDHPVALDLPELLEQEVCLAGLVQSVQQAPLAHLDNQDLLAGLVIQALGAQMVSWSERLKLSMNRKCRDVKLCAIVTVQLANTKYYENIPRSTQPSTLREC